MIESDSALRWLHIFEAVLPIIAIGAVIFAALGGLSMVMHTLLNQRKLLRQKWVLLELTFPSHIKNSAESAQKLFAVLHGLDSSRQLIDKILRRRVAMSLEVVSTRAQGIRYVIRATEREARIVEQAIIAYVPDVKVKRVEDYMSRKLSQQWRVLNFRQRGHFAYPLSAQRGPDDHDSMSYLANAMTKLADEEIMVAQFVVTPRRVRSAEILAYRLIRNEELVYGLGQRRSPITSAIFGAVNSLLFGLTDTVSEIASGVPTRRTGTTNPHDLHQQQVAMKLKPARMLGPLEQELANNVHAKLSQPLFQTDIRLLVAVQDAQDFRERVKGVRDWLALFAVPSYQSLTPSHDWPWTRSYRRFLALNRLPSLTKHGGLFSAGELSELYHFPRTNALTAENVARSLSKTLPAPVSLKNGSKFDVVIGRNEHQGTVTDIGLTASERERHMFIVGGTGSGKTTLLKYAIAQDIKNGKGVAVVDPHGDLAQELLALIPPDRVKDVIYFNPADLMYPIGLNLLEIPEGLEGDELLDAKDFIAEAVVSIMRKTFSDDGTGGHRIEYVLRNAVHTALTVKDATLFTVYDLLMDEKFRKPIVRALTTPWLKNFWKYEYGKAGDFQQIKMMAGVTAKIGRFHASVSADRILSQPKSTINFDDILNGKILICNLAKGLIGEDTSEVLGISILAKLQLAAYRRIKVEQAERRPFYAYVDEFQNFATVSFVQMLSESRKYKLYLTMAEQTVSQQDDQKMVNIIMANVGTIVCFRSSSPVDEEQMLPLFSPYIEPGEIANLPAYSFYARLMGGSEPQEPLSGRTLLTDTGEQQILQRVIASSREVYARKFIAPVLAMPKNDGTSSKRREKQGPSLPKPASGTSQPSVLPIGSEL